MSRQLPRYSLYNFFRLSFFLNVCASVVCLVLIFYHRSYIKNLKSAITLLTAYNSALNNDLSRSINYITNEYFSAASAFASNVLSSASTTTNSRANSTRLDLPAFNVPSRPGSSDDLPPLEFRAYFTVDGIPHIHLRNTVYRRGDFVLGYPIEDISPDVVKYRGKYFKVAP